MRNIPSPPIQRVLAQLGFADPTLVQGRASIADLFKRGRRTGIYVLHCSGPEYYAGKAIDVTRRYVQHRKVHEDIEQISFKEVPEDRLDHEERVVIGALESGGCLLRNILFTSFPVVGSDLDTIIDVAEQEKWLAGESSQQSDNQRITSLDLRRKHFRKYQAFLSSPHAMEVVEVLRAYIEMGVPRPNETEVAFWCCSCLPGSSNGSKLYSRINIHIQEVFTVGSYEGELFFSWHLALSPLRNVLHRRWGGLLRRHALIRDEHNYRSGGTDQVHLELTGTAQMALAVLEEPAVALAIRAYNLGLMRKGPSLNSHSHCPQLLDPPGAR